LQAQRHALHATLAHHAAPHCTCHTTSAQSQTFSSGEQSSGNRSKEPFKRTAQKNRSKQWLKRTVQNNRAKEPLKTMAHGECIDLGFLFLFGWE
jgi:hypothetical protein